MSKIAIFGEGISLAHVSRAAAIAQAAIQDGHHVTMFTSADYTKWCSSRGIPCQSIWTANRKEVYTRLKNLRPMYTCDEIKKNVDSDIIAIESTSPDYIIGDCRNSLRISSRITRKPYIAITNANCTPWYNGPLIVPQKIFPSDRFRVKVEKFTPKPIKQTLYNITCQSLAQNHQYVAKQFGHDTHANDFRTIFTSDDLTLIADDPKFNPCSKIPSYAKYIGPLFWSHDPQTSQLTDNLIDSLGNASVALAYLGSTGSASTIKTLDKLLPRNWTILSTIPSASNTTQKRIIQFKFGNPQTLLNRANIVVCHGGNGTIYQSIACSKFVISHPSFFDQETQTQLLEKSGHGIRLTTQNAKCLLTAPGEIKKKKVQNPLNINFETPKCSAALGIKYAEERFGISRSQNLLHAAA